MMKKRAAAEIFVLFWNDDATFLLGLQKNMSWRLGKQHLPLGVNFSVTTPQKIERRTFSETNHPKRELFSLFPDLWRNWLQVIL